MYLTRIILGKSQAARLKISDAYAWHQRLWEAFPDASAANRNFLFRIDDAAMDMKVLMLSQSEPAAPIWGYWEPKKIVDSFLSHNAYRFQLKANPTMRRSNDRRRLGIYAEKQLREWMQRKAGQHGFDIQENSLVVGAPIDEYFQKNGRRGKHVSVDFQGVLAVRDTNLFSDCFSTGIGSAKAFGFGLLMLQPMLC